MKKLKSNFKYFLLAAGITLMFSCTKSATENKLLGMWKWIDLTDINDSTSVEKWQFSADGKLKVFIDLNGVTDTVPNSVMQYSVQSYKKLAVSPSDSFPVNDYCREWEISKLKSDIMVLNYEEGGLVTKEFVKM